jgi:hypothetical protein
VSEEFYWPARETLQRTPQKCRFGLQKIILWDVVGTNCIDIPEKRFGPVSSLSVTGQNDEATGLEETSSESETNPNTPVQGVTNKDRDQGCCNPLFDVGEMLWADKKPLSKLRGLSIRLPQPPENLIPGNWAVTLS